MRINLITTSTSFFQDSCLFLGFLTTESSDATGNYGLLDQILALEWIRDYARHFGGMNDSVTVMGSGAGGISAHLLTLTPRARAASNEADEFGKALVLEVQ